MVSDDATISPYRTAACVPQPTFFTDHKPETISARPLSEVILVLSPPVRHTIKEVVTFGILRRYASLETAVVRLVP